MHEGGIKKLYYAISEVSEITGLDPHVLRYWETEFAELKPKKNRAGRRVYTKEDIAVVKRIQQLLRDEKYTIEGARQVLARGSANSTGVKMGREDLLDIKTFLQRILEKIS